VDGVTIYHIRFATLPAYVGLQARLAFFLQNSVQGTQLAGIDDA